MWGRGESEEVAVVLVIDAVVLGFEGMKVDREPVSETMISARCDEIVA